MQSAVPFRKGGVSEADIFTEKQQTNGRLGSEGDQHASFVWGVGFGERHPAGVKRAWRSTLRNRSASGESRKAGRNLTEAARYIRTAGGATVSTHGGVTAPESPAGNGHNPSPPFRMGSPCGGQERGLKVHGKLRVAAVCSAQGCGGTRIFSPPRPAHPKRWGALPLPHQPPPQPP